MKTAPTMPPPRFSPQRDPRLKCDGAQIAFIAKALGKPLMPWQRHVADIATEKLPSGRYKYPIVLVTVPRQSGKTTLVGPVQLQRIISMPNIKAFYTAQTGKDARERFSDLVNLVQESPIRRVFNKPRWAAGSEALIAPNGSRLQMFAPGPAAIHGETPPLVTLDEIWHHSEARGNELMGAIGPAQITLPHRQIWMISTMGTALSGFMNDYIARGRAGEAGIAYFEWSIDPAADPYDEAAWTFHPALGITQDIADLRAESLNQKRGEWLRAYCNKLTEATDALVSAEDLAALPIAAPPRRRDVAIGYEVAVDGSAASVYAAWRTEDGAPAIHLVHRAGGTSWLAPLVRRIAAEWKPRVITADDGGTTRPVTAELINPAVKNLDPVDVSPLGGRDFTSACQQLITAARDHKNLEHDHTDSLTKAFAHAVIRSGGDSWRLSRTYSTGPIDSLIAAAAALWEFDRQDKPLPKPDLRF